MFHVLVSILIFFIAGLIYGYAIAFSIKDTQDPIDKLNGADRIKTLKMLDTIFSSPKNIRSYDDNYKVLSAIKELGGNYYRGTLVYEKDLSEIKDVEEKIERALDLIEEFE